MKKWMEYNFYDSLNETMAPSLYRADLMGSITGNYSYVSGIVGKALYLRNNCYLDFKHQRKSFGVLTWLSGDFTVPTEFSWGAWIRINSLSTPQLLLGFESTKEDVSGRYIGNFVARINKTGSFEVEITTAPTSNSHGFSYLETEKGIITTGKWYHLAFTYKNNVASLYVNGEKILTKTETYWDEKLYIPEKSSLDFGKSIYPYTNGNFDGYVCNLCIGKEAWSDSDIKDLATPILARYPLRYNKYLTSSKQYGASAYDIPDCKLSGYNRKGVYSYFTNNPYIINTWNTSFTGRHLGCATLRTGILISNYFVNLSHSNRTISFWYNFRNDHIPGGTILWLGIGNNGIHIGEKEGEILTISWYDDSNTWQTYDLYAGLDDLQPSDPSLSSSISNDTFRLFTLTHDGTDLKFYLDGELQYTTTLSLKVINGSSAIGKNNKTSTFGTVPCKAKINDIIVYATALSEKEIKKLYNQGIKIQNNNTYIAAEFIENTNESSVIFYPKGVVSCKYIEEDNTIENPIITSDGILKIKRIIER